MSSNFGFKVLSTLSQIFPSFQGDPTIFHRGIFLKQTPHIKNIGPKLVIFHTLYYIT